MKNMKGNYKVLSFLHKILISLYATDFRKKKHETKLVKFLT